MISILASELLQKNTNSSKNSGQLTVYNVSHSHLLCYGLLSTEVFLCPNRLMIDKIKYIHVSIIIWSHYFKVTFMRWQSHWKEKTEQKKKTSCLVFIWSLWIHSQKEKKINEYIVRDVPREWLLQRSWKLRACHMNPRGYRCQQTCLLAPSEHRECKLGAHIATAAKLPFWRLEGNLGGS